MVDQQDILENINVLWAETAQEVLDLVLLPQGAFCSL
jgi:hypothetical protein